MSQQPEAKITKKIIDWMNAQPGVRARKVHQTRFSGGEPDIDACWNGRSVKIEVKVPGNTPTPRQAAVLELWRKAGALVGWVTSLEEAKELLAELS